MTRFPGISEHVLSVYFTAGFNVRISAQRIYTYRIEIDYTAQMTHQKPFSIKEIILYAIVGITSIFVLGYSVHMLIGDMVSHATERWVIAIACVIGVLAITFMAWDIVRHRKKQSVNKE